MSPFTQFLCCCAGSLAMLPALMAQEPVPVGKGSYAAFPPLGSAMDRQKNIDRVAETEQRKLYLVNDDGGPIPSTKWYQNLIFQQYGTGLWSYPHKVDATKEGIEIFHPKKPTSDGARLEAVFPLVITGRDFKPQDSRAKSWSDWTVAFRSYESEQRWMDVTLGEGMPAVWCEFKGVAPVISFGGHPGKGSRGKTPPTFFNLAGSTIPLPSTTDALGLSYEGNDYGIFAPTGTVFSDGPDGVEVKFSGKQSFLVICPLPDPAQLPLFHKHAFAIPRDTTVSWKYDRTAGTLSTTWKITTESLQGSEKGVIQGWLPHHWRESQCDFKFNNLSYQTMRGPLRCATGNEFTITYPFHGVLPNLPAPTSDRFEANRMQTYLAEYFAKAKGQFARDTYAAGKDLTRHAQAAFMAAQTKDPSYETIVSNVRNELENWLQYTPGEKERFFAYYPRRKGLVGFNSSFGSEHFTDHHFHYGYFTIAAGLLSQLQPDFASQFGEMARLVAKEYANYDRKDTRFPRFRAFDLWRGHSFADGNGFPEGNNQESTSEAVNSWVGMILLGEAMGDPDLTAAGVMGYTFETRATVEYWFDPHGDVFPKEYKHEAAGMIWTNSIVWGTWFTADPAWIYGIQWIPSAPWAAFFDRDPKFIKQVHANMAKEFEAFQAKEAAKKPGTVPKSAEPKSHGPELGSYHLGFLMHADPNYVVDTLNQYWAEPGDKVAHHAWMANIYYEANALASLGRVDWTCHSSSPTAMIYANATKGTRTFVAWNPTAKPQTVEFYQGKQQIGKLDVPPHSFASKTQKW